MKTTLLVNMMYVIIYAEGCCFYHSGSLFGQGWKYKYSCCGKDSEDYDSAKAIEGCVKGKHRSKHHTDYHYSRYVFYMQEQVCTMPSHVIRIYIGSALV